MNKLRMKFLFFAGGVLLLSQGCAHGVLQKQLDEKLSQETTVKSQTDLRVEGSQLVETAPGLNEAQRSQLRALRDETRSQIDGVWNQSLQLRSILIKDLVTTNYDEDEVELIKTRLRDLEEKRLSAIFNAVDKANLILGHQAQQNQRLVNSFFERSGSHVN